MASMNSTPMKIQTKFNKSLAMLKFHIIVLHVNLNFDTFAISFIM